MSTKNEFTKELDAKLEDNNDKLVHAQNDILRFLNVVLNKFGYLTAGFKLTKVDKDNHRWVWENDYGIKITISEPYYISSTSTRSEPVENDRVPESAFALNTSNRSLASVTRNISREHRVSTNTSISKTDSFHFGVSAGVSVGIEAGLRGTDSNFGAEAIVTAQAHLDTQFGGEHIKAFANEKGAETTTTITEQITLEPLSEYKISATVDKVTLNQDIHAHGEIDFTYEIDLTKAIKNARLNAFKHQSYTAKGILEVARTFFEPTPDILKFGDTRLYKTQKANAAKTMLAAMQPRWRTITTTTTMEYHEAGEINLTVVLTGKWFHENGVWVLAELDTNPNPEEANAEHIVRLIENTPTDTNTPNPEA